MDLSELSYKELLDLKREIEKEQELRREKTKDDTLKKINELAEDAGFSLDELLGRQRARRQSRRVAKYRHPDDSTKTWAGRGRRPQWVESWLAEGKNIEDLRV